LQEQVASDDARQRTPGRVTFAGLVFDLDARTLTGAGGKDVALTPSEFGLLSVLVRGAGRALSRDHLLQAVAGREAEAFDRSIDVLVGRLRRKIEADPKNPRLIVTVPGVGYRFAERPAPAAAGSPPAGLASGLDRPSLAVLPFANLSGDPEQEYFADGMVEEITTALSRAGLAFALRAIEEMPSWAPAYRYVILALVRLGRVSEARMAATRALSLDPSYRIAMLARPFRDQAFMDEYTRALHLAGVPT
jgi:DNA-binding winged helix-turn-helix (wHTH) protein